LSASLARPQSPGSVALRPTALTEADGRLVVELKGQLARLRRDHQKGAWSSTNPDGGHAIQVEPGQLGGIPHPPQSNSVAGWREPTGPAPARIALTETPDSVVEIASGAACRHIIERWWIGPASMTYSVRCRPVGRRLACTRWSSATSPTSTTSTRSVGVTCRDQ